MLTSVRGLKDHLAESTEAFKAVFRNPNLRRLQLAGLGSNIAPWAFSTALSIFVYRSGGASAVALLWLIRAVAGTVSSPFAGIVGDRYRRERVMTATELIRAALMLVVALCVWRNWPIGAVYVLSALIPIVGSAFDPAQRGLMPSLTETPAELTAANVVTSAIEGMGLSVGPAIAGVLLVVANAETVVLVAAALLLWSASFASRIRPPKREEPEQTTEESAAPKRFASELLAGFATIFGDRGLRTLVIVVGAGFLLLGVMEVLVVSTAFTLLHIGSSGVGFLNTAAGVGAVAGAVVAAGLVGIRRLSVPLVCGTVAWGLSLALIGVFPRVGVAVVCLGLFGVSNTLVEVSGFTLIQRAIPDAVLSRAFGALNFVLFAGFGIGAVVAPPLIRGLGIRSALVAAGCFLPAIVLAVGYRVLRIDAAATAPAADRLELLRRTTIFAPLAGATLENLAARLIPLHMEPGSVIIREGDSGDRVYLIAGGQVEVSAEGRHVTTLGPGEYVGEIALLRDVPRTATVTAKVPVDLYALERDDFLSAVTGHFASRKAAESLVAARLEGLAGATGRMQMQSF
jgi:MFS family permease